MSVFSNGVTGQNMTLQFNGQNKITKLPYDLPLNTAFLQKMELTNVFDTMPGRTSASRLRDRSGAPWPDSPRTSRG